MTFVLKTGLKILQPCPTHAHPCSHPTLGTACSKSKYSSQSFLAPLEATLTPDEENLDEPCHSPSDSPRTTRSAQQALPQSLPPLHHNRRPHTTYCRRTVSSVWGNSCPRSLALLLVLQPSPLAHRCREVPWSAISRRSLSPCCPGWPGRCLSTRRSAPCSTRRPGT